MCMLGFLVDEDAREDSYCVLRTAYCDWYS